MDFLDIDHVDSDHDSDQDDKHKSLIQTIKSAGRRKKPEYQDDASDGQKPNRVRINDLLSSIKDDTIQKEVKKLKKKPSLSLPLNNKESSLIQRRAGYEDVSKKISKWDPVVQSMATSEVVAFPLNEPSLNISHVPDIVARFKRRNEMEAKIDQMLGESEHRLDDDKVLTEAEEKYLKAISKDEAEARQKELQKMRALLSYQEVKLKRQKRIKSKKYHRILKKDRLKQQFKEFESLKDTDPEGALEKLKDLDKIRALERASLRHKNTGKWAKHHQLIAKNDDTVRNALSDQVQLSKELMKKQNFYFRCRQRRWP